MNTRSHRSHPALPPGREEALVMQAQSGDTNAFSKLAQAYSPRLLRTALRVVRNPADAEDVVQEALWLAFRHLGSFQYRAAFSSWLTRITLHHGFEFLRRHPAERVGFENEKPLGCGPRFSLTRVQSQTPENICASREFAELVRVSMQRIRPQHREALLLRAFAELSHSEIARRLHIPLGTAKIWVRRGRAELRNVLVKTLGHSLPEEITWRKL